MPASIRRPRTRPARPASTSPWAEEFRLQLADIAGLPARGPAVHLTAFGVLEERLQREQLSWGEVQADLHDGIYNVSPDGEDPRRGWARYRIATRHLDLKLHAEPWNHGQRVSLAVLDRAFRRKGPPTSFRLVPAQISLSEPGEGTHYDLGRLTDQFRKYRWAAEAEQTLTRVTLTLRRHAGLRAEARRQYGSLRALLELARQRAEMGDTASTTGTVIDGHQWFGNSNALAEELVIRLDKTAPFAGGESSELAIWREGEAPRNPDRLTLADLTGEVAVLALPDAADRAARLRRQFPAGAAVVVSETGEFRYRRHLYALRKFLDDEEVVGNWTSLAALMCTPGDLAAPAELPEIMPGQRPLNHEQRLAVAGAMAAPHAFFIQGPPGTGKTQVITDLAARLTARGERVLLTAPTHVAVDEVLSRLASEPGVLPVRLSYADRLVDKDVRQFTKTGYDSMLARDLRIPATSKITRWQSQLDLVTAEHQALTRWQTAAARLEAAQQRLAAARAAKHGNDQRRQGQRADLDRRLAADWRTARDQAAENKRLEAEYQALTDRLVVLEASSRPVGRLLDRIGLGTVSRLRSAQSRLKEAQMTAARRDQDAALRYNWQRQQHDQAAAELDGQERRDAAQVAESEEAVISDRAELASAEADLAAHGAGQLGGDPAMLSGRISRLDGDRSELSALILAQQRWFELLGLTGRDDAADRERARAVISKALISAVNLVCSTTTGFGGDPDYRDLDYDTLIVDEASKVTGAEFLIPARAARRWILVGDEKQLPPYVEPRDEHHIHAMAAIHLTERDQRIPLEQAVDVLAGLWREREDAELHPFRDRNVLAIAKRLQANGTWANAHKALYAGQITHISAEGSTPEQQLLSAMHEHLVASLFERCAATVNDDLCRRLIYQRRMPAEIAELVRVPVYGGDYRTPSPPDPEQAAPLVSRVFPTPVVFLDTSLQPSPWQRNDDLNETSIVNDLEAAWVRGVCEQWEHELRTLDEPGQVSVSVLAFYSAQASLIRRKLGHPLYKEFPRLNFKRVDPVDRIQGQQSDLVIISFCRTFPPGPPRRPIRGEGPPPGEGYARWLQNINRLNVACTRARRSLVLIGHQPTLRRLHGVQAAETFYANLFSQPRNVLTMRTDWMPEPRRRQR